jgi:hypothetical protein
MVYLLLRRTIRMLYVDVYIYAKTSAVETPEDRGRPTPCRWPASEYWLLLSRGVPEKAQSALSPASILIGTADDLLEVVDDAGLAGLLPSCG